MLVPIHDPWQPGFHLSPGDTCSASLSATPMATEEMWKAGGGWKVGHPQQGASSGSRILHISVMLYPFQTILRGVQDWDVKHFTFGGNPKQKGAVERCGKRIFLQHCSSPAWKPSHRCSLDLWQVTSSSVPPSAASIKIHVLLKHSTHGTMAPWQQSWGRTNQRQIFTYRTYCLMEVLGKCEKSGPLGLESPPS